MTETCRLEGSRSQAELPKSRLGNISVHMEVVLVLPSMSGPPWEGGS